ncbi:MAG: TAXI family TRAP transporter solute-binding subunit [Candidatus Eiseniibacteriota bacterium]
MKMSLRTLALTAVGATLALAALPASEARAEVLALAADRPGTTFNAMAAGIAKVVDESGAANLLVRPYAGPAAWAPLLDKGEVKLGAISAISTWQAFNGKGEIKTPLKNIRILRSGEGSLMLGFIAGAKSDIKELKDVRGKRVSSNFGGHIGIQSSIAGELAVAGMTWKDVTPVPVVGANDGIDALVAGRLDVTWASLGQPQAREADVKIGIRYLPLPNNADTLKVLRQKVFPAAQIVVAKKGSVPGVEVDTPMLSYDAYLVANKDLPDAIVTKILAALWDKTDELVKVQRSLAGFKHEAAVTDAPVAPYHPAAVAFYKSKGLWDAAAEARQEELLKKTTASN